METGWTEVTIRGALIDPVTGEPTILLENSDATSFISVPGDPSSTGALIQELEGIGQEPGQALLYRFFVRHGVVVERLDLSRSRNGPLGALLTYRFGGGVFGMEVRPVDGLIIASQTQSPVYADDRLLASGRSSLPGVADGRDLLILSRRANA